jgi:hypothetical protein
MVWKNKTQLLIVETNNQNADSVLSELNFWIRLMRILRNDYKKEKILGFS